MKVVVKFMDFQYVMPCNSRQTFFLVFRVLALKMKAKGLSKMWYPLCSNTQHHIAGDCNLDAAMRMLYLTKALVVYVMFQLVLFIRHVFLQWNLAKRKSRQRRRALTAPQLELGWQYYLRRNCFLDRRWGVIQTNWIHFAQTCVVQDSAMWPQKLRNCRRNVSEGGGGSNSSSSSSSSSIKKVARGSLKDPSDT
jgi:hypothetical protein